MPRRSRSFSRSRSRSYERGGNGFHHRRDSSPPPRGGRYGGRSPNYDPACQIYVARFSKRTREADLRRAFERYGRIVSIDIKFHGCFAFIVYQSVTQALDAIEEMDGRTLSSHDVERLVVEQAGANRARRRNRYRSRSPPYRSRGGPRSDDLCYNCGRSGHWAADCNEETDGHKNDLREGRCFACGKKGHKRIDCPTEGGRGARRRSYSSSGSHSPHNKPPRRRSASFSSRSSEKQKRAQRSRSNAQETDKNTKKMNQSRSPVTRSRSRSPQRSGSRRRNDRQSKRSRQRSRSPARSSQHKSRDERQVSPEAKRASRSPDSYASRTSS